MKRKLKKVDSKKDDVKRWELAAKTFEDPKQFEALLQGSRVLAASEERALFGPGKSKQISIRLPESDLMAIKDIADAAHRPYQQLVAIAVQQYIDRVATVVGTGKHRS